MTGWLERRVRPLARALVIVALGNGAAHANGIGGELMTAIRAGDHEGLRALLRQGQDPNGRLADGSLPLAWAIERQDPAMVTLLLDHGARVDDGTAEANPFRPLVAACLYPQPQVLRALLDRGPDVQASGPDGISVLALCAAHAPAAVVRRLLALGAEVDAVDDRGQTPLMWAAAHGRIGSFELLRDAGADVNRRSRGGFTPLLFAIKSGSAAMADAALAAGGDPAVRTPDGTTAMQLAMYQHNHDFALHLAGQGVDVEAYDRNGHQLLHKAVLADRADLAARLLAQGADVDALTGESAVEWRYESNFRAGDYQFPARSPLLLAADAGLPGMMRLLAEAGADPGQRDPEGNNLVLTAAASGVPEALTVALELAPDANVRNARRQTPVHRVLASASGAALQRMLATLAAYGAAVDLPDDQGRTAADIAGDEHFKDRQAFTEVFLVAGE